MQQFKLLLEPFFGTALVDRITSRLGKLILDEDLAAIPVVAEASSFANNSGANHVVSFRAVTLLTGSRLRVSSVTDSLRESSEFL